MIKELKIKNKKPSHRNIELNKQNKLKTTKNTRWMANKDCVGLFVIG